MIDTMVQFCNITSFYIVGGGGGIQPTKLLFNLMGESDHGHKFSK